MVFLSYTPTALCSYDVPSSFNTPGGLPYMRHIMLESQSRREDTPGGGTYVMGHYTIRKPALKSGRTLSQGRLPRVNLFQASFSSYLCVPPRLETWWSREISVYYITQTVLHNLTKWSW